MSEKRPLRRDREVPAEGHLPVMLEEVLEALSPREGETHADLTLGAAGHGAAILARLGSAGLLLGVDRDAQALELARTRLEAVGGRFRLFQGEFSRLPEFLRQLGGVPEGALDGALLDLGVSSMQLDQPERGFSFLREGPLDMRMAPGEGLSAADLLERSSVEELERILRELGEEKAARRIARAVERARRLGRIETTTQLARIIEEALPRRGAKIHPATRSFQGIRIAVNRELDHLRLLLRDLDRWIRPGGRVAVLSYHSLEDRIVKQSLQSRVDEGIFRWREPPVRLPTAEEIERNPRSRSAKMRSVVRA